MPMMKQSVFKLRTAKAHAIHTPCMKSFKCVLPLSVSLFKMQIEVALDSGNPESNHEGCAWGDITLQLQYFFSLDIQWNTNQKDLRSKCDFIFYFLNINSFFQTLISLNFCRSCHHRQLNSEENTKAHPIMNMTETVWNTPSEQDLSSIKTGKIRALRGLKTLMKLH